MKSAVPICKIHIDLVMWCQGRVLGFSKRLATLCLQLLHNGTIAGLALLRQLLVTHTAAEQLLDSEHEVSNYIQNS